MRMCLCLCVVVASILFASSAYAQPSPTTKPSALTVNVGEVKASDTALADVMEMLRDKSSATLFVNWKMLEAAGIDRGTKVTVDLDDATLEQALKAICSSLDKEKKGIVAFADRNGVAYLSTADDAKKHETPEPLPSRGDAELAKQTAEALERALPEINFNSIATGDALEFLKDITKLSIEVNWDALEKAGIKRDTPVTLRIRNLPVNEALRLLLDEISNGGEPLNYVVDGNKVLISTDKDLRKK
jgi:hypothetical protein